MAGSSSHTNVPLQTFQLANQIKEIDPQDAIFKHDSEEDRRINREAPWKRDPHYFRKCRISAVALIKMVIHARSGGIYEIMGLMQGRVQGDAITIMDSFALPVQGTETRVNAGNEAIEYMSQYKTGSEQAGRKENVIGWYHSHPGYGCWLSGIDVSTQSDNQKFQDPFIAVVIDPNRTISAGKVEIGAFRTYPEGYRPTNSSSDYQSIPLEKIEDFGVHADSYYPIEISVFKSKLDDELLNRLFNKYWVNTLSQTPLISNRAYAASQLSDLAAKLTKAQSSGGRNLLQTTINSVLAGISLHPPAAPESIIRSRSGAVLVPNQKPVKKEDNPLEQVVKDSARIVSDAQHGLIAQILKDIIFSNRPSESKHPSSRVSPVVDTVME
ncbi:JAB1/Mov34/MPN/PAD-1 ubiquitin protease-domain-containing protein [Cantharellus anzutake]|uniref:JAB1/Mov34/MPN/PAD-1 ubiquitin protease-domain-containing protein n=1 Tax=Cantharellus anzutake TaxID=1750568 RepID=UPI001905CA48|nr:JAB1/Mov34/MPN/PAD-1 ubiquitin protease-domain-containing protein [Cantharellus anzutake]KAF8327261.1 JAB1/Mov34/MPN/PAD-1 ubiquitin protease-domain-containing protein [Cantharellus anzutake]